MTKLRCSSHTLAIEKGRHTKPKTELNKRICYYCKCVEDEIHFLLNCPIYSDDREKLLQIVEIKNKDFDSLDNSAKFRLILENNDPHILKNLGKFVYNSFEKRDEYIRNMHL